jgi:hypothetical protein
MPLDFGPIERCIFADHLASDRGTLTGHRLQESALGRGPDLVCLTSPVRIDSQ